MSENIPVEFLDVKRVVDSGAGHWQPCSGCYDTEDGHPTQRYTFSAALRCELGHGCSECGGLGAVWIDYRNYEDATPASENVEDGEPPVAWLHTVRGKGLCKQWASVSETRIPDDEQERINKGAEHTVEPLDRRAAPSSGGEAKAGEREAFDVALDALSKYQTEWDTGMPGEYASAERIHMESACEAVREALENARDQIASAQQSDAAIKQAKHESYVAGWQDGLKAQQSDAAAAKPVAYGNAKTLAKMMSDPERGCTVYGTPSDDFDVPLHTHPAAVPVAEDARDPRFNADLQDLKSKLLGPHPSKRDEDGMLIHPDMPLCDEGIDLAALLALFGVEAGLVMLEYDNDELATRYFDSESPDFSYWNPSAPDGDGWVLVEMFDTESGPCAMFCRDAALAADQSGDAK